MRIWFSAALATAVLLGPRVSEACAVCFSATDENRTAFIVTTALLTTAPLLMVGGLVLWLRARVRQLESDAAVARDIAAEA